MYMRKLGITHLRSRASLRIIIGILVVLAGLGSFHVVLAQSTSAQPQPPASTPQPANASSGKTGSSASIVTSTDREPQTVPPAAQGPSTNPPPPWPAPEPAQGQTPAKDNDIFKFYALAREVILHAT